MGKINEKLVKAINIICVISILFPILIGNTGQVYGFREETLWDAQSRTHTETLPDPGDWIEVPSEVQQTHGDMAGTKIIRDFVYSRWQKEGMPKDENGWCYLPIAGVNRYMVALAPLYGLAGDYVDIYIENDGVETLYPCIMVDCKDVWNAFDGEYPYVYNDVKYGHKENDTGLCKIVEVILDPAVYTPVVTDSVAGVTRVQNGGNIQVYPDGPVGLDGKYNSRGKKENSTFLGFLGGGIRSWWVHIETKFENLVNGRDDSTVLYVIGEQGSRMGSGDIVKACEEVTQMLIERGCKYPSSNGEIDYSKLDYTRDIENQLYNNEWFCCATYVAAVLYYSGVLTADQINAYNYHWTGNEGIPSMLEAAGWKNVAEEGETETQPGDVINDFGNHVLIAVGNGKYWDQNSAVFSTYGSEPTGDVVDYDISGCQIWRKP